MPTLFAKIVAGEIPCHRLAETAHSLAFLDIQPLRPGHALVIPKRAVAKVQDLPVEEFQDLTGLAHGLAPRILKAVGATDATWFLHDGADAGQEVPHVHLHIVPAVGGNPAVHSAFAGPGATDHETLGALAQTIAEAS